jgi:hypothetical protein
VRLGPPCRRPIFTAKAERDDALAEFLNGSPRVIYSNTVVNGPLLAELRPLGGKDRDACARTTEIHRTLGAARLACSRDPLLRFVWIGGDPVPYMEQVRNAGLKRIRG